jgi:sugar (pentulose or hexulose) kinase
MPELVLALDIGTQSTRGIVFDPRGKVISSHQILYKRPYFSPEKGWAEQHPDYFWQAICQVCAKIWHDGKVKSSDLAGLALTTQRGTVINLDAHGRILRPAIIWPDQRRSSEPPPMQPWWPLLFRLAGAWRIINYFRSEAEINWLWQHQPDIWEKTAHFLFLSGYLHFRLCGQFVDAQAAQVGYVPFDYKRKRWHKTGNWRWQGIRVNPDTVPQIFAPGEKLGEVSKSAAAATGLAEGLPLIAAGSDKSTEILGAGCLEERQGVIGFGTTATISLNSRRYIQPMRYLPAYPSALPGHYNPEIQIYRGLWMVSWFKENFAQMEVEQARGLAKMPEQLLDASATKVPPGCDGLLLQPYWTPGVRLPGLEARGSIIGFTADHTQAHLYRAIYEGLAYALREGKERLEKKTGIRMREIRACGGGTKSNLLMQISADILNLPVIVPRFHEMSALGAAMLAATGLGLHSSIELAVSEMSVASRRLQPNAEAAGIYDELYRQQYLKLYRRLRPLFRYGRQASK